MCGVSKDNTSTREGRGGTSSHESCLMKRSSFMSCYVTQKCLCYIVMWVSACSCVHMGGCPSDSLCPYKPLFELERLQVRDECVFICLFLSLSLSLSVCICLCRPVSLSLSLSGWRRQTNRHGPTQTNRQTDRRRERDRPKQRE